MHSSEETLREYIQQQHGLTIARDAHWNTAGLDSMQLLDLIFQAERQYGLNISDNDLHTLHTLEDLIEYIDAHVVPPVERITMTHED